MMVRLDVHVPWSRRAWVHYPEFLERLANLAAAELGVSRYAIEALEARVLKSANGRRTHALVSVRVRIG
jgi:hypothetical protein